MAMVPSSSALPPSTSVARKAADENNLQPQHAAKLIPTVDLAALESAGRVLHDQLVKDAQTVPELGDMLSICTCYTL